MINIEKYKNEICDIMTMDNADIAFKDGKVCNCNLINCDECDFQDPDIFNGCRVNRINWFLRDKD